MSCASLRRAACLATVMLAAAGTWSGAQAQSSCKGVLRASLVHPLPIPLTLGTARSIADTANPELALRFASGLQRAGLTLGEDNNATLSIAVSVTAAPGNAGVPSGFYKGFEWMSGKPAGTSTQAPSIRAAILSISAVVTDDKAAMQSWVGTIDCSVQTDDAGTLAEYIGHAIGRAIGKNVDRTGV